MTNHTEAARYAHRIGARKIDRDRYETLGVGRIRTDEEIGVEFDRFLAKVKADAWDEGLDAGRDRWMDSREFGDTPRNPYRIERDER